MSRSSTIGDRRERIRKQYFGQEPAWTGEGEVGWSKQPRTMPLLLHLLRTKKLTGTSNPAFVYQELFSRHVGQGIVEMATAESHAFAAGYVGPRAVRTWQERMKLLVKLGFVKTVRIGNEDYKYVLLIHPTVAVQRLRDQNKIDNDWWNAYQLRKLETKEPTYEQYEQRGRSKKKGTSNLVQLIPGKASARKQKAG